VRSVVGANFSGATLDNIGNGNLMSGPNSTVPAYLLEGANFYGATIKNCSIDGYTQGTTYSAAYFINCDITGAYQNADFYSTRFVSCILGADFAGSNLATAEFSSNQLANGLNFAGATLAYLAIDAGNSNAINIYGNPNPYRLRPEVGFTYTGDNGNMSSGVYYFLNGEPTPLFPGGFGVWNGIVWRAGVAVPNYTGTACDYPGSNAQYWINGVETTLDCSGNGDWNGQTYVNGVVQGGNGGGTTSVLTRIAGSAKFYGKVKFSA
jgi:hypothetical protein